MQLQDLDAKWPKETPGIPSRHGVTTEKLIFCVLTVKHLSTEVLFLLNECEVQMF